MTGRFITLEGVDGAGKSTHIPFIAELMTQKSGDKVIVTREPGGTTLGESLRSLLLHENMHPETETLLMFASRREHLDKVIFPALNCGHWVLCDRFTDSTYAYQHGGRLLPEAKIQQLETWVQGVFEPDLTILFDVPVEISSQRLEDSRSPDRFEKEKASFFERVRTNYLERAALFPERYVIIDSRQSIDVIQTELLQILNRL